MFNPGTAPLPTAHVDTARENLADFIIDVCRHWDYRLVASHRRPDLDMEGGRFGWVLEFDRPNGKRHTCQVQMFGVSRDYGEDENPLVFPEPRLYVDGSSWIWPYAVSQAGAYFDQNPDDESHPEHREYPAFLARHRPPPLRSV